MGLASKLAGHSAPSQLPANSSSSSNPFSDNPPAASTSTPHAASSTPSDPFDSAIPEEAPPAYTPAAPPGDAHIEAGPARMDFSGPPPMPNPAPPNRLENQITGVGVGYGPRRDHGDAGGQYASPSGPPPPMPPRHPSQQVMSPSATGSSLHRPSPSGSGQDLSPTQVATPGRPLLRNGMLLVYPKGFTCHKCNNTGYKNNDPSNPHDTDWKKYGKPFTGALAHSYTLSPSNHPTNASTQTAQNFQRPLPQIGHQAPWHPQGHGVWDHPGNGHPPPPPPMQHHNPSYGHGGMMHQPPPPPSMIITGGGYMPQNAVVVRPGDPRLGGQPCYRCGGQGRELDWLGFDQGKCWGCRGVGRVF